jgi:MFS family permease
MLFGARALQGAFAALLAPAALSLITVTFTEMKERSTAFAVYGAIAAVTALAALPIVRESRAAGNTSYDIPGAATVTGGLVSLVHGFTLAAQDGWTSGHTLVFLGIAAVLLVAFIVIETTSTNPLLPMRIILDRNCCGSDLSALMVGSGLLGMFLFLTYYFQGVLGYSTLEAGFAFLPFSVGIILAAGAASKILPLAGPGS